MTRADLARDSGLSPSTITRILNEDNDPGVAAYKGIAKALNEPIEKLLRVAGESRDISSKSQIEEDLLHSFRSFTLEQQIFITSLIRGNRGPLPSPLPETAPDDIMDVLKLLDEHRKREAMDFIRWLYREQVNPSNSSDIAQKARDTRHNTGLINIMLSAEKATPEQRLKMLQYLLGRYSSDTGEPKQP